MSRLAIVTDSTACIPESLLRELKIRTVPYYIHRGSEVLRDLITVDRESFYRWLPDAAQLPKTASPGAGDYMTAYQELAEAEGVEEIITIHMTSKGSGAYQAAMTAKSMIAEILPRLKIEVIDTLAERVSPSLVIVGCDPGLDHIEKITVQIDPDSKTHHPQISTHIFRDAGLQDGIQLFIEVFQLGFDHRT